MMTYDVFLAQIRENISDYFEDVQIEKSEVVKHRLNNGGCREKLLIRTAGSHCDMGVDMEPFYQRYLSGSEMETIMREIADVYFNNMDFPGRIDLNQLGIFEYVSQRIYIRLINYEKNREMLLNRPHIRKMDLAYVFRIYISNQNEMLASSEVTWELMKLWHVDMERLFELAKRNTMRLFPPMVTSMGELMKSRFGLDLSREGMDLFDESGSDREKSEWAKALSDPPVYVVTNSKMMYGAAVVFYPDTLKKISDKFQEDLFVLPSSVHEMLVLPRSFSGGIGSLSDMVREVNASVVSEEEQLSDHAYYYMADEDEVCMYKV